MGEQVPGELAKPVETIKKRPHVILEIGCEGGSFLMGTRRRQLQANERYIGVDNDVHLGQAKSLLNSLYPDQIDFIKADATKLPFADGSISEVVLCNVFGDPRTDSSAMMTEINRIINPKQGSVTVVETYSPIGKSIEALREEMATYGNLRQVNIGQEMDRDEVEKYADVGEGNFYYAKFAPQVK